MGRVQEDHQKRPNLRREPVPTVSWDLDFWAAGYGRWAKRRATQTEHEGNTYQHLLVARVPSACTVVF